jgi:hypothetical protein
VLLTQSFPLVSPFRLWLVYIDLSKDLDSALGVVSEWFRQEVQVLLWADCLKSSLLALLAWGVVVARSPKLYYGFTRTPSPASKIAAPHLQPLRSNYFDAYVL